MIDITFQYIPLHVHTCTGSVGDSVLRIKDYVKRAKELDLKSIAITDHGSMSSIYAFYNECKKNDIKPIIGCEIYECENRFKKDKENKKYNHLVLLCKNNEGLSNLIKIVNESYLNGFYYKPRTDMDFVKLHSKGLIALSACVGGKIPELILENKTLLAEEAIYKYKEIFEEFYLEIQPGKFEEQIKANKGLIELSNKTNTEIVITNDIHYLNQEDYYKHDAHVKMTRKVMLQEEQIYSDKCYWFMSTQQLISNSYDLIPTEILISSIQNTFKISNICNVSIDTSLKMPSFLSVDESETLYQKCISNLSLLDSYIKDPPSYSTRLLKELEVIYQLGFSGYFLIVEDFINYARNNCITIGPGRGSVGGSLVAFLLGISLADPITHELSFDRFLSLSRKSIPDIDIDIDSNQRAELIDYVVSKYGVDFCSLVSTFIMRRSKSVIRDLARISGVSLDKANKIAKLIPVVYYDDDGDKITDMSIKEAITNIKELKKYYDEMPEFFDLADELSNFPSFLSTHAAGVLISPINLRESIPLIKPNENGVNITSLNLEEAESIGIVKFDFLSLNSISIYEKTKEDVGAKFDYLNNKFDDENVWSIVSSLNSAGLFQISSKVYRDRMYKLKPTSIKELANCLALIRGPCISSGADKKYINIVQGKKEPEYIHELYYDATRDTYGILIYQEDLMKLAVNFGLKPEDGHGLIKAISKKKIDKIQSFKEEFYKNAHSLGVSDSVCDKIFKIILDSGKYLFNKSHAISYAILTYESAFLKTYHTKEFLTNTLTNAYLSKKDEVPMILSEMKNLNYEFLLPDINNSSFNFTIEDEKIRTGFCAIKCFGNKASIEVIKNRPYESLEDFTSKAKGKNCSKKNVIPAIFSGAFDSFNDNRSELYSEYMSIRKEEPLDEILLQTKDSFLTNDSKKKQEKILLGFNIS